MIGGLELDRGLEHLERRRIRGGFRAAGLAEHARNLRHGLDHPVGLLQQLGGLSGGKPGQGGRHVEQVAFVQRRHEFASDAHCRIRGGKKHQHRDYEGDLRKFEHLVERRPVERDEPAIERVLVLVGDLSANKVTHQHRNERDGKPGRGGHRIGLGEGERRKEPPFLRLEREHRHERERDDEEREEERRPDLRRRIPDHAPLLVSRENLAWMRVIPRFDVLVRVLDHHHRGVHHGSYGDSDAAERHDVGVHALVVHDDERRQDPQGQGHNGHERRAQVKQENAADDRHDDEFLDELVLEVRDRALDEVRAVVRRDDLHARGQARLELLDLRLHRVDGLERILARTHHDHAARDFAFAVQLRDAAAHLRADLDSRHVPQANRYAGVGRRDRNLAEIVERLQVAGDPHHVLGFPQLQHRAAGFLVGVLDRHRDLAVGDVVGAQPVGIEDDLVLAHHAADARHFRDVRHGLQLVLEKPILQRSQLRQVHLAAAIDERVFVHPADPRGIGAEGRFRLRGQPRLDLVEVLEDPRARPVGIGAILEQDVDEGIAKHREGAHGLRAGHRKHGGRQRVGHLVLDDLRRLARVRGTDDHLHIGQVRNRVERRAIERPHAPR